MARLALTHCDPRADFVGHVGGDDFMLLFQSSDWLARCQRIVDSFAREAIALFDESARQEGGIWAEDRHGVNRFFRCTTLSIGAVRVSPGSMEHAEEVANLAALAKRDAKQSHAGIAWRDAGPGGLVCLQSPLTTIDAARAAPRAQAGVH